MSSANIKFLGEHWRVDFDYSAGTNFSIHSASLEPNDPEEIEITRFSHERFGLSNEFLEEFFLQYFDGIHECLWRKIQDGDY